MTTVFKNLFGFVGTSAVVKTVLTAAVIGAFPGAALADHHRDRGLHVDIDIHPGRRADPAPLPAPPPPVVYEDKQVRVWVDPVYQTATDRQWVPDAYQTVTERVWVPAHYELRDVADRHRVYRQQVLVPAHYEDLSRQQLVPGHYQEVTHQVLVTPGHWETHIERVPVAYP